MDKLLTLYWSASALYFFWIIQSANAADEGDDLRSRWQAQTQTALQKVGCFIS